MQVSLSLNGLLAPASLKRETGHAIDTVQVGDLPILKYSIPAFPLRWTTSPALDGYYPPSP